MGHTGPREGSGDGGPGIGAVENQSWARRQGSQGFFLEHQEVWAKEGLEQWFSKLPNTATL